MGKKRTKKGLIFLFGRQKAQRRSFTLCQWITILGLPDHENKGTTIYRNVRNFLTTKQSHSNTAVKTNVSFFWRNFRY